MSRGADMECRNTESHIAHMEINGECPNCGAVDHTQTQFGSIDADGTIRAADGSIIEYGSNW